MASLAYDTLPTDPAATTPTATTTTPTAPRLVKGASDAQIDQTNQWMRQQPWYQSLLKSWGQDPGHPHNLSDQQKTAIVRAAQFNGMVVDEGHIKIDDGGNFSNKGGSLLKDILIGAGIGGLALTGLGIAGIGPLSGLLGGGAATAGAGAADLLPSTVLPQAFSTLPAVTSSLTGTGALIGSAAAPLASTVLPQALSTLPNVTPSLAPSAFAPAAAAELPVATTGQGSEPGAVSSMGTNPAPTASDVAPGAPTPGAAPEPVSTDVPGTGLPTTPPPSYSPVGLPSTPIPGLNTPTYPGTDIPLDTPVGQGGYYPPGLDPTTGNNPITPPAPSSPLKTTADILKQLTPYILGGAAQAYGANTAANASVDAAKISAAEYDKALAQAKEIWQAKEANLAPYMNLGASAAGSLAYGLGLSPSSSPGSSSSGPPTFSYGPNTTPLNLPPGTTVPAEGPGKSPALANPATLPIAPLNISSHLALGSPPAGFVRVKSPNGTVSQIPVGQLVAALQQGWTQV